MNSSQSQTAPPCCFSFQKTVGAGDVRERFSTRLGFLYLTASGLSSLHTKAADPLLRGSDLMMMMVTMATELLKQINSV